jgi:hypothetical protein
MNVELLRKVQAAIRNDPQLFDMGKYFKKEKCGTVCCIAGHALVVSGSDHRSEYNAARKAANVLDINFEAALTLFHVTDWPDKLKWHYHAAQTQDERVEIACKAIDLFIENGGRFLNTEQPK